MNKYLISTRDQIELRADKVIDYVSMTSLWNNFVGGKFADPREVFENSLLKFSWTTKVAELVTSMD